MGLKSRTIDKGGNITQYEYDYMGNVTKIIYPDKTEENYKYDIEGKKLLLPIGQEEKKLILMTF